MTKVTQTFLDSEQYRSESIRHYELVYGEDFVSPGGRDMAREMIARLNLPQGARVLDVGCGIGGSAFVMAGEFGLQVDGIDLSENMLEIARQKLDAHGLTGQVNFEWGDCLELDRTGVYDAIYSRDVFLHIHQKQRLFKVLYGALREGGQLLFTDYCSGPKPWPEDFAAYVESRSYDLHTPDDYVRIIEAAGFNHVTGEDYGDRFSQILRGELNRIEQLDVEPGVRDKLAQSWQQKIERSQNGVHRWGLFTAIK